MAGSVLCGAVLLPATLEAQEAAAPASRRIDDGALRDAARSVNDWLTDGRDCAETRFSPLNSIHAGTVKHLGLAWSFDTETTRGLEATPLVATANCLVCHGVAAVGGGVLTDLRYSPAAVLRSYRDTVLEGSHASLGMPSFSGILTAREVEAIRLFVLSQRAKPTKPAGGR